MIRTREQLLDWIGSCGPTRAIRRAIEEGTVEVLGGFNTNPPCWIVRVTSTFKHIWNIAVYPNGRIRILEHVNWRSWEEGNSPLCRGDYPERYTKLRDTARRIHARKDS